MVNHFASLLGNLNLWGMDYVRQKDVLGDRTGQTLATQDSIFFWTGTYSFDYAETKGYSPLINRAFNKLTLPTELQSFYNILFPENCSEFYKEFLLYCYLRLVNATDRSQDILQYDSRISYNLSELNDYFKFSRINSVSSSDPLFSIFVGGKMGTFEEMRSSSNMFIVEQVGSTRAVMIRNVSQGTYYSPNKAPSKNSDGMEVYLVTSNSGKTSAQLPVGDLGLYFFIDGDMSQFSNSTGKLWSFNVEAPFVFDTPAKINELDVNYRIVDAMLAFRRDDCNLSYENLWNTHYNSIYRLSGLLHAYVERVNKVWEMYL